MSRDKVRQNEVRTTRTPVSSNRAPLTVRGFDQTNQKGRWVNDIDDRIARFLEGGYQFVNNDGSLIAGEATAGSSSMLDSRVKKPVGKGTTAYLMALPRDLYDEDQRNKQREIDAIEESIKRPNKSGRGISEEVDHGKVTLTRNGSMTEFGES